MSEEAHGHGGEHREAATDHSAENHAANHGAEHHEAGHGTASHGTASHRAEARTHAPAAAGHTAKKHEAHAPAAHSGPAKAQSAIASAFSKAQMEGDNAANSVIAGTTKFGDFVRKVLRAEVGSVEKKGIIQTPFYAVGHTIDATVLNAGRRAVEAIEPVVSGIRAFFRLTIGNILHPINMLAHPIERIAKPSIRMITSGVKSSINQLKIPLRAADDLVDRGINRITQQVNHQISRIPAIGKLISGPTNWIAKQISHVTAGVRRAVDFVTKPVDVVHDAVAPA